MEGNVDWIVQLELAKALDWVVGIINDFIIFNPVYNFVVSSLQNVSDLVLESYISYVIKDYVCNVVSALVVCSIHSWTKRVDPNWYLGISTSKGMRNKVSI